MPVARATNLTRTLREYATAGFMIAGLDAEGSVSLDDFELATDPLVLVVGSEGKGLSRLVKRDLRRHGLDPDGRAGGVAQRLGGGRCGAGRGGPPRSRADLQLRLLARVRPRGSPARAPAAHYPAAT